MRILMPSEIVNQLSTALNHERRREIGGILMGEYIDEEKFRIIEITIQTHGGTVASFTRFVKDLTGSLRSFFDRTHHEYTRFNYLGEWHSHQNFALVPSKRDECTMHEIVTDPESNVTFAILLLVRIGTTGRLESTATLYQLERRSTSVEIVYEYHDTLPLR